MGSDMKEHQKRRSFYFQVTDGIYKDIVKPSKTWQMSILSLLDILHRTI